MSKFLSIAILTAALIAGCSDDKSAPAGTGAAAPPAAAPAVIDVPPMAESDFASGVIDHARDEKEFELRRSIWGVESLIEHYRNEGYDTSELEAQKAALAGKLKALLG